ncbi:hypothetical protein, partial [Acutalibacter intestini]|uniref:hypothetical protein n=1 Tax=Acutalibacter intestini TaxID=3093659 RepID=UPI002AC95420
LDLTKQAEKNEDGTYSLPVKMYDDTNSKHELKGEYTLVVSEDHTVAFDSADLRTVRVNQSWKEGNTSTTISAISGEAVNEAETISIVLPLGLTADKVGLGQNMDDEQARRIFVPESPNATVEYFAPTTDQTKARVVVTARDGKTKTFNVTFSYEQALRDVAIIDREETTQTHDGAGTVGEAQGITMDANGDAVIYIPVTNNKWLDNSHHTTSHFYARFASGNGLVRVEDPQPTTPVNFDTTSTAWSAGTNGHDEPIVSVNNTIRFVDNNGVRTAWLTVITKANWDEDDSTLNNRTAGDRENVYANVKIVLSAKAGGGSGSSGDKPKLYELQLDGYQAKVNRDGWEDGDEIDIYVSNNDYITSGWDTYQGKRISALTSAGATISIPEQSTAVHGPYWQVIPTLTDPYGTKGRLEKGEINNVNIAGHQFNLQITSGGESANIKVNLLKAAHYVPEMTGFRLYDEANDEWYEGVQTSYRGDHFVVTLPQSWGTVVPVNSRVRGEGKDTKLAFIWQSGANSGIIGTNTSINKGAAHWVLDFSELVSDADFHEAISAAWTSGAGTTAEITAKIASGTGWTNDKKLLLSIGNAPFAYVDFKTAGVADNTAHTLAYSVYPIGNNGTHPYTGKVKVRGAGTLGNNFATAAGPMSDQTPSTTTRPSFQIEDTVKAFYPGTTSSNLGDEKTSIQAAFTNSAEIGLTYSCALGYTYDNQPLHNKLTNFKVYADISDGTYATPGGKGFGVTTKAFGMNGDANGNGRKDSFEYAEIENHITTVKDIWTGNYTVDKSGKETGHGKMSDYLVLRVTNSENNVDFRDYTIELRPQDSVNDGVSGGASSMAEITVGNATTALDNDLVYGGNTIAMIANRTISYTTTANTTGTVAAVNTSADVPVATPAATDRSDLETLRRFEGNTAYADAANPTDAENDTHLAETAARLNDAAAYVGAIKDGKNSFPIEVKDIPGVTGAKVLEVTVPYNYKAQTKAQQTGQTNAWNDDGQKVYFTGVTASKNSTLVRWNNTNTKYEKNTAANINTILSLDMNIQDQQGASKPISFIFTEDEIAKAWNGTAINRDVMSKANVLYLYSKSDEGKAAGYVAGATTDHSATAPGEKGATWEAKDTMPTMIYYVVAKRAPVSKNTALSSIQSNKPGQVDVNVNWSQKIIDVSIPYSWNWGAYREDNSHDFTFNFAIDENATLIDVMHDTPEVPMKANRSTSVDVSEYEGKRQGVFQWISGKTQFFVRNGMLYTFDPDTGDELQITGIQGDKDEYRNYAHGVITSKDTELRIYDQDKKNINTYKLRVNIKASEGIADIKTLKVGESFAELAEDGKTYNVKLTDEDQASMLMEITTASALATVEVTTVDGTETYDANNYLTKRWNLTEGATIKVTAEDDTSKVYNLVIGEATEPTPSPTPSEKPSPSPTPDFDVLEKYPDLAGISAGTLEE